jgi:lysophospholipase L1-like esterase
MKTFLFIFFFAGIMQATTSCSKSTAAQIITQPIDTFAATIPAKTKTYLALGDSYTIGQSIPFNQNYPNQTVALLNSENILFKSPVIIATTGWTTQDLLNAIADKPVPSPPYDLVTLLIGVNNQYQQRSQAEYKQQFTSLLEKSIVYAGNRPSHVIVISIPDYSVSPYGQSTGNANYITLQIDSFNLINKQVADSYRISYLNVTDTSRKALNDTSLFAADGLHFSGKEYAKWATMLLPIIDSIFK